MIVLEQSKRIRSAAIMVLLVAVTFGSPEELSAQLWPTFRKDVSRSGFVSQNLHASRLQLAWSWMSEVPPSPAWDGPARWDAFAQLRDLPAMRQYDACFHPVSDGEYVFFGSSSQDTLTSLRLTDGSKLWSFVAGGPIRLAPALYEGNVYFGCDDGYAYCLDRLSGKLKWKFSPSYEAGAESRLLINNDRFISCFPIRTGVAVRDGIAYFGASLLPWRESYICAVDAKTGQIESEKNTFVKAHENVTLEGCLLIAENRLIVPQGRIAPIMFDRNDGKSLGSLPGGGGVTIVLTESGDVVRTEGGGAARAGHVGVFKGKERVASFPRGRSMVVRPDNFYVIDQHKLLAASRMDNELRWQRSLDEPLETVMAGDILFVGGRDHITAVNSQDGKVVWTTTVAGRAFGLAIANQRLIAATDTGGIYVFAPTAERDWQPSTVATVSDVGESPAVPPVAEPDLIHRWVFHRSAMTDASGQAVTGTVLDQVQVQDQTGNAPLKLTGSARAIPVGDSSLVEAIELNKAYFPVAGKFADTLPTDTLTATAWVRVDEPSEWGGMVGCIQDNGSTEHGWILGYRKDKFCIALAGGGSGLTYLTAETAFQPKTWYHVAGTYDGQTLRLYVNGSLAATSSEEQGPISYAEQNRIFTIAAYKDENETYPLRGALHAIRIYSSAVTADDIRQQYAANASEFESAESAFAVDDFTTWGPIARFIQPDTALIRYGTKTDCPTVVDLITEEGPKRFLDQTPKNEHQIQIDGLPFRRELQFQLRDGDSDESKSSPSFTLDTHLNWAQAKSEPKSNWAAEIIENSPNPRGIAIVLGAQLADRARELALNTNLSVVLVAESDQQADQLRGIWLNDSEVRYGRQLSVLAVTTRRLPAASAAVVICDDPDDSARRLVRPSGGILHDGSQVVWTRGQLEGSGSWSHMYGAADNSAFGGETLSGASTREDLVTQWIGPPGPRYQTDRQNRKPSPLAAGGRLFMQGQQRMIALDNYSGSILWSIESPTVMRWNMPHDCSNWCADEDGVYVAAEDRVWFVDGKTGQLGRQYELPNLDSADKPWSWGYVGRREFSLLGTAVSTDAIYTNWWGSGGWFDSTGGADTHVVAGDFLFSLDIVTGKLEWQHRGLVLHPTITVVGDRVYFVEDRTSAHVEATGRRISLDENQRHVLVCLDAVTGEARWERPLPSFAGHVACLYLAGGGEGKSRMLVLVASESSQQQFSVKTFDLHTGQPDWSRPVKWESNHHGKHISRPAIQGELLYLRPEVMKLADGETMVRGFPSGHGCSSYTLFTGGLLTRLGETTWWDVRNQKVNRFNRIRTDCWISVVPAQGMLLSAEGGGGCSCGSWMETTLGFLPRSVDELFPSNENNRH